MIFIFTFSTRYNKVTVFSSSTVYTVYTLYKEYIYVWYILVCTSITLICQNILYFVGPGTDPDPENSNYLFQN